MIIKCDVEGKKIIDNLINISVGAGGFKDVNSLNAVLKSIEIIEPAKPKAEESKK